MTSEPLLLHSLAEADEEHQRIYDEEQQYQSAVTKKHARKGSVLDGLIPPAWARQRKSLCNVRTISIGCLAALLVLFALWLFSYILGSASDGPPVDANYFFIFGDSYSRVGFSAYGAMPSVSSPFGNMQHPPTTTGGRNWVQMLTIKHNSSLTLTYDMAAGGATVDKDIIPPPHDMNVQDFNDQLYLFRKALDREGAPGLQERKEGVFAVWFGQNDVDQVQNRTFADPIGKIDDTFDVYFDRVSDLWHLGAREFIFIGVSPISKSPMVQAEQNVTEVAALSRAFNDRLQALVKKFAHQHAEVKWHYYDPASAFNRVWDNPKRYGISDGTCMDWKGIKCVWHDHFHPGIRVHEQVAADIAGLGCKIFAPQDKRNSTIVESPA